MSAGWVPAGVCNRFDNQRVESWLEVLRVGGICGLPREMPPFQYKALSAKQRTDLVQIQRKYGVYMGINETSSFLDGIGYIWKVLSAGANGYIHFGPHVGREHIQKTEYFIINMHKIKPDKLLDFQEAVVKYLWPKIDYFDRRSTGVNFELHTVVNGSEVIVHCWFYVPGVEQGGTGLNMVVQDDFQEDKDALSDAGDSDYDDDIHSRGGIREPFASVCSILHGLTARISALERAVDTTVNF